MASDSVTNDDAGAFLTALCWVGLGIAALDAFIYPLPHHLT
jgi:hypothetical protein